MSSLPVFSAKEEVVNCPEHTSYPKPAYDECPFCDYEILEVVLMWGDYEIKRWRADLRDGVSQPGDTYQGASLFVANKFTELFK